MNFPRGGGTINNGRKKQPELLFLAKWVGAEDELPQLWDSSREWGAGYEEGNGEGKTPSQEGSLERKDVESSDGR